MSLVSTRETLPSHRNQINNSRRVTVAEMYLDKRVIAFVKVSKYYLLSNSHLSVNENSARRRATAYLSICESRTNTNIGFLYLTVHD